MSRIAILSLTVAGVLGVGAFLGTTSMDRPARPKPRPVAEKTETPDVAPSVRTDERLGDETAARETLLRQVQEGTEEQAEWGLIGLIGDDSPEVKELLFFLIEQRSGRVQEAALTNLVEIFESLNLAERERARANARALVVPGLPTGTRLEAMELLLTGPDVRRGDIDTVLGLLGDSDQPEVKLQAIRLLAEADLDDPALRARLSALAADPAERAIVREISGVMAGADSLRNAEVARRVQDALARTGNP